MTKSTTKSDTTQTLSQRIDRILDIKPEVKIRKLDNGAVQVNGFIVKNRHGAWMCANENFFRRKSAVGYALCLIRNDHAKANEIKKLDKELQKYKVDIDFYHYHMRRSKNDRATIMENRISRDMPYLYRADTKLTQLLKTVKV